MNINAIGRYVLIGAIISFGNYMNNQNLSASLLWGFGFVTVVVILARLFLSRNN